jgi:serine/threonine protein kinase
MSGHDSTTMGFDGSDSEVDEIIAAYLQQVDAGVAPDPEEFLSQHAHVAAELREFLADLDRFAGSPVVGSSSPADAPPAASNSEFPKLRYFGEYELIREIARGGMGVVYEARQKSLKRTVAVKMILGGVLASDEDVRRFRTEAQAAAGLQHPGIVSIHEVGVYQDHHYFSMDLIDGLNLAELVKDGALHHDQAVALVHKLAEAVDYAHTQGTLHRDLKPSNILIDETGAPRITDFGLAKLMHDDSGLTATGARLGTPSYMPPEQAAGESDSVGPAIDIYSLGSILYELLTGRPPFRGSSVIQTLHMVVNQPPVSPRDLNAEIPRDLANICLKCLQKIPADRYGSSQELADDLTRFTKGEPVHARPIGPIEKTRRRLWKHRRNIVAATAIISIAAACFFIQQKYIAYTEKLKAQITFTTSAEPLTTEIRDDRGGKRLPVFTTPTAYPVSLEPDNLRVRVSKPHQLSEEFRLRVGASSKVTVPVEVEDRSIFSPLSTSTKPYIVTLANHADIIVADKEGVERIDGANAKRIWKVDLSTDETFDRYGSQWIRWIGDQVGRQSLLADAPDLDDDDIGDLVWLSGGSYGTSDRSPVGMIAQSGVDGRILWIRRFSVPKLKARGEIFALKVVGEPLVELIDGDATPDLVVTSTGEVRHVEAISGQTGQLIWKYEIARSQYEGPFHSTRESHPHESDATCLNAIIVNLDDRPHVIIATGRSLVCLDARTGAEAKTLYSKDWPIEAMTAADLNADDLDEILIRHKPESGDSTLTAIAPTTSSILWQRETGNVASLLVENVDHQGPAEVIIAVEEPSPATILHPTPGICRMLNGLTGEVVWSSVPDGFRSRDTRLRIKQVSDLNHDGVLDVLTAHTRYLSGTNMLHEGETLPGVHGLMITVSALSGRNGRMLWVNSSFDRNGQSGAYVHGLHEWTQGSDGVSHIVVTLGSRHHSGDKGTSSYILRGSGHGIGNGIHHPKQELLDADEVQLADFNGDGHLDLYWFDHPHGARPTGPVTLHTIAGSAPVMWRRLGEWHPYADFNGDGITDLLNASRVSSNSHLTAVSGINGRVLWHDQDYSTVALPLQLPGGDLDDDQCADIITFAFYDKKVIRQAVSGKTGNAIWTKEDAFGWTKKNTFVPGTPFGTRSKHDIVSATAMDVEMDGSSEVVVLTAGANASEVIVLDGMSGDIKLHTPPVSRKRKRGNLWTVNKSQFQPKDTPSLRIVRNEEKQVPSGRAVRDREMELTLETLDGTTGHRIEKRPLTRHNFPQIALSSVPAQTWYDRPHLPASMASEPTMVQISDGPALFFVRQQTLMAVDRHDRELCAFRIPDRLFKNHFWKINLSAADIDGDGLDELITMAWIQNPNAQPDWKLQPTILALKLTPDGDGLAHEILWEWTMPFAFGDVMTIDVTESNTPNITACSGNTVFNIDARTGVTRWSCDGPKWWFDDEHGLPKKPREYDIRRPVVLQTATDNQPARILFLRQSENGSLYGVDCRFSVPAE